MEREMLTGNLIKLEQDNSLTLSGLKNIYLKDPERSDLSEHSLRGDELALRSLLDVVGDIPIAQIGKGHISKFKQASRARGIKPVSINTYLRRIRAVLNYAKENEYLPTVPPKINLMKTGIVLPRVIESADLEKIQDQARKTKPEMFRIIKFAMFTGTRRSEIIRARYEHISDGSIKITGKGKKERIVPLIEAVKPVIGNQTIGKIFSYMHPSTISNYYREITRAVGVDSRFHDLRHTAATQMLTMGVPLEVIQKILGHAELRTTQIYSKVVQSRLKNELEKLKY